MSLLHRTFVSLYAKIDNLVGEIENHDALIKAAIGEQRQKITAAKMELRRLEQHQERLQKEVLQCTDNEALWSDRAAKEAESNEEKALLCLQRRQSVREKKEKLISIQKEHGHALHQLKRNIAECEADLKSMMQKHQLLKARQSTSEVMHVIDKHHTQNASVIAESFDRWELQISKDESYLTPLDDSDIVEQEYLDKENTDHLRHELAELLKNKKCNDV